MLWYSLQDDNLQDIMGMNVVNKNMVYGLNLDGMWIYDHKVENAWAIREKDEKLTSRSFQGPTSWRRVTQLIVSKEE